MVVRVKATIPIYFTISCTPRYHCSCCSGHPASHHLWFVPAVNMWISSPSLVTSHSPAELSLIARHQHFGIPCFYVSPWQYLPDSVSECWLWSPLLGVQTGPPRPRMRMGVGMRNELRRTTQYQSGQTMVGLMLRCTEGLVMTDQDLLSVRIRQHARSTSQTRNAARLSAKSISASS